MKQPKTADPASGTTAVATTIAANVLLATLGGVTGVLAARMLGPIGRGELAAIQAWPTFLASLAALGMPEALVFLCARHRSEAGRYIGTSLALCLAAAAPTLALGWLIMPLVLSAQPEAVVHPARAYLLLVPIGAVVGIPYHALRGLGDFRWWNALRLIPGLLWLTILLTTAAAGGATAAALAGAFLTSLAVLAVLVVVIMRRRVRGPFTPTRPLAASLLRFGLPSMLTTLPQTLNLRLDQMLMAGIVPPRSLGLYVAAVAWSSVITPLLSTVGMVLFPRMASLAPEAAGDVLLRTARMTVVLSGLLGGLALLVTPFALELLFGTSFSAAVPVALVLVVAAAVLGIASVLEDGLRGLGRPENVLGAEACGLIVTGCSLVILVGPFGILGAAISSLLGYATIALIAASAVKRRVGCQLRQLVLVSREDIHALRCQLQAFRRARSR